LLVPQEFDFRKVPGAVWWINYWDPIQVETVTAEKARGAGWDRMVETPDGAMALVATAEPTDVTNAVHRAQLRLIIERLDLLELQREYRLDVEGREES
jgi:hypothetical protein